MILPGPERELRPASLEDAPTELDVTTTLPATLARLPRDCLQEISLDADSLEKIPERLEALGKGHPLPAYLPDLARLELGLAACSSLEFEPITGQQPIINPTLKPLELGWSGLHGCLNKAPEKQSPPRQRPETLLLFQDPASARVRVAPARSEDLLALKIIADSLDPVQVAREEKLSASWLCSVLDRAWEQGLIIRPEPGIKREPELMAAAGHWARDYAQARVFTLQWHITQACDLHCRHCYDRKPRSGISYDHALNVLQDLDRFCSHRKVRGQVSFTGGNPLLHPDFDSIFSQAGDMGFRLAILGNPAPRDRIEALITKHPLSFYQVSLEGLPEHNDWIRGPGHFERTLDFLALLRELSVPSQVMLTLTRDNMDQVLPLAERLQGLTGCLTFNRLSQTGEGSRLALPDPGDFAAFLRDYARAADTSPVLGLKENLLNLVLLEEQGRVFGGCTGFGCGAAFNFVALLPDGEVHACRKFPSMIGNISKDSLADIYDSEEARMYRAGPASCRSCSIRPVCGGCQAVISSSGLDIRTDRDPFCLA